MDNMDLETHNSHFVIIVFQRSNVGFLLFINKVLLICKHTLHLYIHDLVTASTLKWLDHITIIKV